MKRKSDKLAENRVNCLRLKLRLMEPGRVLTLNSEVASRLSMSRSQLQAAALVLVERGETELLASAFGPCVRAIGQPKAMAN